MPAYCSANCGTAPVLTKTFLRLYTISAYQFDRLFRSPDGYRRLHSLCSHREGHATPPPAQGSGSGPGLAKRSSLVSALSCVREKSQSAFRADRERTHPHERCPPVRLTGIQADPTLSGVANAISESVSVI